MHDASTVAMIGLGIMGGAIATRLVGSGRRVCGYDVDAARVAEAVARGVIGAPSVGAACSSADVILCSLPHEAALASVVDALAASGTRTSPAVLCELSTLSVLAKEAAREALAPVGITVLDCPLSGTGAQAVNGDLVAYSSGDEAAAMRCREVLSAFCREVRHCGAFGTGMRTKLIANLLVAIHNVAAAEALALGKRCGLDPAALLDALRAGAGTSRMLEVRGPLMVAERFEPPTMKLDVWQKDLRLIDALAREVGSVTPLFAATLPVYAAALEAGLGGSDTAAVYRVLSERHL